MEFLFYECDAHMWRITQRKIPTGVRIDGGSDWLGLDREFCEYAVGIQDELARGLKAFWQYSLLPSEVCCWMCDMALLQLLMLMLLTYSELIYEGCKHWDIGPVRRI